MNTIIDPNTNQKYSLFSKKGKKILKNLLLSHEGGMEQQQQQQQHEQQPRIDSDIPIQQGRRLPITEDDRQNQDTFSFLANRLQNQQPSLERAAFSYRNVIQNIRDAIPEASPTGVRTAQSMNESRYQRLSIVSEQNYHLIQLLARRIRTNIDRSAFPNRLSDLNFFSENELQNLRRNNIIILTDLIIVYLRSFNENSTLDNPSSFLMNFYNFLEPLLDDNNDDVRRAIRILSIINTIASLTTYGRILDAVHHNVIYWERAHLAGNR